MIHSKLLTALASIALLLNSPCLVAETGASSGGGGDLDAAAFVQYASAFSKWALQSPKEFKQEDAKLLADTVAQIDRKMDGGVHAPIEFSDIPLKDEFSVEKMALFTKEPMHVKVFRPYWNLLSTNSRLKLVALELFGIIGVQNRYSTSAIVDKNFFGISRNGTLPTTEYDFQRVYQINAMLFSSEDQPFRDTWGRIQYGFRESQDLSLIDTDQQTSQWQSWIKKFEAAMRHFHYLPGQVRFDIITSGIAEFRTLTGGGEKSHVQLPLITLNGFFAEYVEGISQALEAYLENVTKPALSKKVLGELSAIQKDANAFYQSLHGVENTPLGKFDLSTTPVARTVREYQRQLRRYAASKSCQLPVTFDPMLKHSIAEVLADATGSAELDVKSLRLEAVKSFHAYEAQIISLLNRWEDLRRKENLESVEFPKMNPRFFDRLAKRVSPLHYFALEILNAIEQNFSFEVDELDKMLREVQSGKYCHEFR